MKIVQGAHHLGAISLTTYIIKSRLAISSPDEFLVIIGKMKLRGIHQYKSTLSDDQLVSCSSGKHVKKCLFKSVA